MKTRRPTNYAAAGPRKVFARQLLLTIETLGPLSIPTLLYRFRHHARAQGHGAVKWMRAGVDALIAGGFVEQQADPAGEALYRSTGRYSVAAASAVAARAARALAAGDDDTVAGGAYRLALPRSFETAPYTPPRPPALRPGAMDHAACRSMIGSHLVDYRSGR